MIAPSDPAARSAKRGPPATTTTKTPCSLPRISSGAATCRIVDRNVALTMSSPRVRDPPPYTMSASSGNSARGCASTIAQVDEEGHEHVRPRAHEP